MSSALLSGPLGRAFVPVSPSPAGSGKRLSCALPCGLWQGKWAVYTYPGRPAMDLLEPGLQTGVKFDHSHSWHFSQAKVSTLPQLAMHSAKPQAPSCSFAYAETHTHRERCLRCNGAANGASLLTCSEWAQPRVSSWGSPRPSVVTWSPLCWALQVPCVVPG